MVLLRREWPARGDGRVGHGVLLHLQRDGGRHRAVRRQREGSGAVFLRRVGPSDYRKGREQQYPESDLQPRRAGDYQPVPLPRLYV